MTFSYHIIPITYIRTGGGHDCEDFWFSLVQNAIGHGYTVIAKHSLWHIRMIVFVKNYLLPSITNIWCSSEGTGIGNMLGNKGGVSIALNIGVISYLFINTHLAAHTGQGKARNKDLKQIISSIQPCNRHISTYHAVYIFGDLNYRWQGIDRHQVNHLMDTQQLQELKQYDELRCILQTNGVLYG